MTPAESVAEIEALRMRAEKAEAEREAAVASWQRASGCVDPLTLSDALFRIGKILGRVPPMEGIPDAAHRVVCERDDALRDLAEYRAADRARKSGL